MKLQVRTSIKVIAGLHSQVCLVRSLLRLTESINFQKAFDTADDTQKDVALKFINNGDQENLRRWIKLQLHTKQCVDNMSMRDLRQIGQQLGVKGYHVLTKGQLIEEVKLHQKGKDNA